MASAIQENFVTQKNGYRRNDVGVDQRWAREIHETYFGKCKHCGDPNNVELHHRLPKHKRYKELFPLFIDSPFNLVPLCGGMANNCHVHEKHEYTISVREAALYERYLEYVKTA